MRHNTVFITGGSGYIGSHLTQRLDQENYKIVIFDVRSPHKSLCKQAVYVGGDVRNLNDLVGTLTRYHPNTVIHLASRADSPASTGEIKDQWTTNVIGTKNVLEAMKRAPVQNLIFASSAAVYGGSQVPIDEEYPLHPQNHYGKTKLIGEQLIQQYQQANRLNAATLRLFNVVGYNSNISLTKATDQRKSLMTNLAYAMLRKNPCFTIYGKDYPTADGTAVRDYVHIEDVVDALHKAICYVASGKKAITVNIGSGIGTTNLEVIRRMERLTRSKISIRFSARRIGEIDCSIANNSMARRVLMWKPNRSSSSIITRSVCGHYGIKYA